MITKRTITVQFQVEGIHRYPAAATDPKLNTKDDPANAWLDVSFLANEHRHMFHFRVTIGVVHNDRDLEFIQVKRILENQYKQGLLHIDHMSCEMLAEELIAFIAAKWPGRTIEVSVFEDGENGGTLTWEPVL